jgi:hypothetical protein
MVQRHVGGHRLAECLQRVEAEADDFRGEADFIVGFGVVGGEHLSGGARVGHILSVRLRHPIDGCPDAQSTRAAASTPTGVREAPAQPGTQA